MGAARLSWVVLIATGPALGQQSVVDSKHNLSVMGPGPIRAATEQEVCIFCHTPHNATPVQPLWNRRTPVSPYTAYTSSALDAEPGQPTGASKMCLSCHDGSIALGSVVSRDQVIRMAGGITTLPPGSSNLGTDLSDDHPISFRYGTLLAAQDDRLVHPQALPPHMRLDANEELQCTTCHDAHDDTFGDFLVMDNTSSSLCLACHRMEGTNLPAHMQCRSCHQPHSAPSGPFLLVGENTTTTCTSCHDGSYPGAADILAELTKTSVHDTGSPADAQPGTAHTTCSDCHEPHTMLAGGHARAPAAPANFGEVRARASGGGGAPATYEYEVCFRCHGDANLGRTSPWISRQIVQASTRLQFEPSNPSYHPVVAAGRNPDVPSLRPGLTEGSLILCSDCHGSDGSRKAGGGGPNGVHGSIYPPLLLERYDTMDFTAESLAAYALCYMCHQRDGFGGILTDVSFPHRVHVVDAQAPCSACHAAHGVSAVQGNRINNSHLINFDTGIVYPNPLTGRAEYRSLGRFSGSCTLVCHGVPHSPLEY